jgi:hypothetical protein
MTQVLILLGVFLAALMLHYFIVVEGFSDSSKTGSEATPFSELIDKLTFFSTSSIPTPGGKDSSMKQTEETKTALDTTKETVKEAVKEAVKEVAKEGGDASSVKAAEPTDTKKDTKNTVAAPTDAASTTKDVVVGPKDVANESIAERTKEPVVPKEVSSTVTNVLQQGKEFLQSGCKPKPRPKPTPPPCPAPSPGPGPDPTPCNCPTPKPVPFPCNSSDYIRKDQIPCWGCTLK